MPDIGLFELLVIGVILFVVLGPERMPEFFGQLGRIARHGRNWWSKMSGEISSEVSKSTSPFQDIAGEMHEHFDQARAEVERTAGQLTAIDEVTEEPAPSGAKERRPSSHE